MAAVTELTHPALATIDWDETRTDIHGLVLGIYGPGPKSLMGCACGFETPTLESEEAAFAAMVEHAINAMTPAGKLAIDITRLDHMAPDELARETGAAELAALCLQNDEDLAYRAALEKRARLSATSTQGENMTTTNTPTAVSSDPELIARIQTEQRFVEGVRAAQRAAGLQPAVSGDIGYAEWRRNVLRACTCGGPAVCPVHGG